MWIGARKPFQACSQGKLICPCNEWNIDQTLKDIELSVCVLSPRKPTSKQEMVPRQKNRDQSLATPLLIVNMYPDQSKLLGPLMSTT